MKQFTMNGILKTIKNGTKSGMIENYYVTNNDFHVSYRPSKDEFYVKAQFVGKKTLEDYII